jgi:hypothetical protein
MFKFLPKLALFSFLFLIFQVATFAQLTGTKNIPGDYATITLAVADLNTQGVGAGGVIFNVVPGYTETISAPISLTATGTLANPIVFQKSGVGVNPLITSYVGGTGTPGTAVQDGLWNFVGSDYITINGIDLIENPLNVANPATMEYGYALYKANATNGCQNIIIQNCVITLNRINNALGTAPMTDGSAGIIVMNATSTAATTALVVASPAGSNSFNHFYANTIQNSNIGIALIGYADSSPFANADQNNEVGGSAITGNIIRNFGGGGTNPAAGVRTLAQYSINVSFNTVNNNDGGGINHAGILRGIYVNTAQSANSSVTHNTISVKGGGTTQQVTAIENVSGSTAATNTVAITNNVISNCTYTTATSGVFYGVYNNGATPTNLTIKNNIFSNNSTAATSGSYYPFYNAGGIPGALLVDSNSIAGITLSAAATSLIFRGMYSSVASATGSVTFSHNSITNISYGGTATGEFTFIYSVGTNALSQNLIANSLTSITTATSGSAYFLYNSQNSNNNNILNNTLNGFTKTGAGGTVYLYYNFASASGTSILDGNSFTNITLNGATTFDGLECRTQTTQVIQITNNTISNVTGGTSATYGIYQGYGAVGSTINNNTVTNISGGGIIYGIHLGSSLAPLGLSCHHNQVNNITGNGAANVVGIYCNLGAANAVYDNKIHTLTTTNAGGTVYGISFIAGTNNSAYNNIIGNLTAPIATNPADVIRGISITSTTASSTQNIYYNSIYLNATSSGTNFSTSGIFHTTSATATTATLNLRNNIIVNLSTPSGTGVTAAYRRSSATLTNYGSTSDNNLFYAGTPSANRVLMYDGTTGYQTLASYQALVTPRDANTITENPPFLSTVAGSVNFLHMDPFALSGVNSGAQNIAGITDDYDGNIRFGNPGYVGGGSAPDIGADEYSIILALDMGVSMLLEPSASGCHTASDTIRLRINNFSNQTIHFASNPVTISSNVTGVNPQVFPNILLNTDSLVAFGFLDTTVFIGYNMSAVGTYTFHASTSVTGDGDPSNDTLIVNINITGGTANASQTSSFCAGELVDLTVTGQTNGGTIQWQQSINGGFSWTNIAGGTTTPYSATTTDTTLYRAEICGSYFSTSVLVTPVVVEEPMANDVTRCGPGVVTLTATSNGPISWYDAPSGGTLLDTGATFMTNVVATTNFYPEASTGSAAAMFTTTFANNNGASGNMFAITALNTITVTNFDVNSTAVTSNWSVYYRPDNYALVPGANSSIAGWTLLGTATGVVGAGAGIPTPVPVFFSVTIPAGQTYSFHTVSSAGGAEYTNGTLLDNVYSSNADLQFREGHGCTGAGSCPNVPRVFNGNIYYSSGCTSTRDTVTVTVTPSDTIMANVVTNPICSNQSTVINVTSINPNYQYTWSPASGLSSTTGSSVTTTSDTTITYTVSAVDTSTNCAAYTYANVNVLEAPTVNITTPDTALCMNATLQFDAIVQSHTVNEGVVGTGVTSTTATNTVNLGPYGGLYGGAKHQYLYTATELQAAGLTAGAIGFISFEVTALNSVPPLNDYTIKMGETSLTALTVGYVAGLPTLYTNPSYMPTLGWNSHELIPLNWDGISNLIVEVCFNNMNGGVASGNASVRYTATTGVNTANYYRADDDPNVCGMLSGTPNINRPNIRFSQAAPVAYHWTPAMGLSNQNIVDPVLTAISTNTYTLQVMDSVNGCTQTDNVNIIVNPPPVFTIGNDTNICSNTSPTPFGIFASNGSLNYVWFDNTTLSGTVVNGPGTYYATGTDANGCSSTDTMVVGTVDPADVDININVVGTNSADLDAGPGFTNYLWSTSQTSQMINIIGNGTYYVQVTDVNGCPNADTVSIIFSLGLEGETGENAKIIFYPNPSSGIVNMSASGLADSPLKIEIMEISGKMVYEQNIQHPSENFVEQLDLTHVSEGIYMVRVTHQQQVHSSKIIIARK